VREYPAEEILQPELAERRDEIGELARAVGAVTHSLDAKRKSAAELAADLAHELKNPLATIAASAELIASTSDPSPEKRAMVEGHIQGAVERMRDTTDELLRLMRLDVSLGELAREEVDYRALVESVLGEYRRDPRFAEWKLTLDAPAELPRARLVPSAWGKLLRNLLDNALVQPAERKEIVLTVREGPATSLVTEIRDFGPGISEGNRDKIFRRFFTQRPEGVPPGTGLGLSIVQTVAESHRGRVEVDSPMGGGALFRVWLPR
jgi:two-component system sensor histidine kinase ChvG